MLDFVDSEIIVGISTLLKFAQKVFAQTKHVNLDIQEHANMEMIANSGEKDAVSTSMIKRKMKCLS